MENLISAKNVTVIRDRQTILDDVSVDVGARDFLTIIGPNGAGKSMLLKCLMGFYAPDKGHVTTRPGLRVGYVPQRLVADPTIPITVRRFLTLRKKVKQQELDRVIAETAIEPSLNKPLAVLSGGELQRVLLARALLNDPELLVLDEPAQNLDITGQLAFYKLLETVYRERNISVLMVSHDLHLVMSSTRNVLCLFHEVCCIGEPRTVTRDPEFISLFGPDMAQLMASYQHHDHHAHSHGHSHDHSHADACRHPEPSPQTTGEEQTDIPSAKTESSSHA
ncbi:ATP-binding cassette domain-containing protein [Sneathiella chinensis]|uniref:Zinc import ATP-binding protein ZnuC n=1 Tax=Sneathiella chinensis TaxID=349750 RepID=A0ABQ5U998_9PROT|nr:ATP-binding cassette domain-containing protein [Sneathiella chinensis]GLQ07887.1 zinc import ATP-binding protein ZnuC [Sneathiella chinensis]